MYKIHDKVTRARDTLNGCYFASAPSQSARFDLTLACCGSEAFNGHRLLAA